MGCDMRYIDADKLKFDGKLLKDNENELIGMNGVGFIGKRNGKTIRLLKSLFKQMIENAPTEDVIPRAEIDKYLKEFKEVVENEKMVDIFLVQRKVAREIFEVIHKEIELAIDNNYKVKQANGYGEFLSYVGGKIDALRGIEDFVKETKKKYIGE